MQHKTKMLHKTSRMCPVYYGLHVVILLLLFILLSKTIGIVPLVPLVVNNIWAGFMPKQMNMHSLNSTVLDTQDYMLADYFV